MPDKNYKVSVSQKLCYSVIVKEDGQYRAGEKVKKMYKESNLNDFSYDGILDTSPAIESIIEVPENHDTKPTVIQYINFNNRVKDFLNEILPLMKDNEIKNNTGMLLLEATGLSNLESP